MRINGRKIQDDDVIIDVTKAVEAYQWFMQNRRSSESPSTQTPASGKSQASGNAAFEFDKAIKSRLQALNAEFLPAGNVLASKQTYYDWSKSPPRDPVKRKRSVLIAVLSVTGRDISANGILAREPLNLTPLSELAPLQSRRVSNDPDEVEGVVYEIELAELILKASEMTVMSDWLIKDDGEATKTDAEEVGTVTVGLTEADIVIDFGETEPLDWTRRFSATTDPFLGRADGCVILWNENRRTWIIQPTEGSPMRVRAEQLKLCKTKGRRGAFIDLCVTATEDQVFTDFRMRRHVAPSGEVKPTGKIGLAGDQLKHARERLFSIVLAHRPAEADIAILSIQRHKLL